MRAAAGARARRASFAEFTVGFGLLAKFSATAALIHALPVCKGRSSMIPLERLAPCHFQAGTSAVVRCASANGAPRVWITFWHQASTPGLRLWWLGKCRATPLRIRKNASALCARSPLSWHILTLQAPAVITYETPRGIFGQALPHLF